MPLGAARLNFLSKTQVVAAAEVIRKKKGITALANAQIDTAQYKFGGASALFDGTGDLLQLDTSAALTMPSSEDFTIEGWIRPGSLSGTPGILTDRATSASLAGVNWDISVFNGTYITSRTNTLLFESASGGIVIISNNNVFTTNTWYHFAVVRSSNVITLYVNGVDVTDNRAGTQSAAIGAGNLTMGGFPNGALMYTGHLDEIRWSNTARYTSGFTPSTTPFVNDDDTLLLLHMDGSDASTYFDDDNGVGRSAVGVSAIGDAQIDTAQSKFGGASVYFDGNDDRLQIENEDSHITLNSDYWTVEGWFRIESHIGSYNVALGIWGASNKAFYFSTNIFDTTNKMGMDYFDINGVNSGAIEFGSALSTGTWIHLAWVNNNGTVTAYQNGTSVGTHTLSDRIRDFSSEPFVIGSRSTNAGEYQGWMDEIRISNTARYTSGFTPSTAPFVNDSNTLLLLHMDGTDGSTHFEDDNGVGRAPVGVSANGNAQVDTAQSKFGGASADFDGVTGTYLQSGLDAPDTYKWATFTDYTLEFWFYANDLSTLSNSAGTLNPRTIGNMDPTGNANYWSFGPTHSGALGLNYFTGAVRQVYSTTGLITTGTWYHAAMVKNGTSIKHYLDGTEVASATISGTPQYSNSIGLNIGQYGHDTIGGTIDAYIDEVRISDTARYTSGFTPSTTPFQNDANTLLLLHCDGTDGDTDFVDDNGKEAA